MSVLSLIGLSYLDICLLFIYFFIYFQIKKISLLCFPQNWWSKIFGGQKQKEEYLPLTIYKYLWEMKLKILKRRTRKKKSIIFARYMISHQKLEKQWIQYMKYITEYLFCNEGIKSQMFETVARLYSDWQSFNISLLTWSDLLNKKHLSSASLWKQD